MCKIFTTRKLKNKPAQKILSMAVSLSLMLAMIPNNGAFAVEPDKFVTSAKANHWGRSDLRSYMNGVAKDGKGGLPLDTTNHDQQQSGYYESQFSGAEYGLVHPFRYKTNVLNSSENATAVYETTDKFWLPSGSFNNDQILSWGAEDISANAQYTKSTANDKARIIPISYWSYGASTYSWLRSSYYDDDDYALLAYRGRYVYCSDVNSLSPSQAAACKIHLTSVIFASAASAASFAAEGGAKKLEILGSSYFGKKTSSSLPSYGMYLKTGSGETFTPTTLIYNSGAKTVTVNYSDGVAGQYVVVHAFKEDSLEKGTTSYAAAAQISADKNGSVDINVSAWDLSSLDGYTIKVWMEDNSGDSSLAATTEPVTFYGKTDEISDTGDEIKNARVFAMKEDLQCSWGDLSKLPEADYNNVLSGNNTSANGGVMGVKPTNQKIYFGGMEFWIAGREDDNTQEHPGEISPTGEIMTLYQAKSVEKKEFNNSWHNYSGNNAVTLQLEENKSGASYPLDEITTNLNKNSVAFNWQHRKPGTTAWTDNMPTNPGNYEIRCYAEGTENYERTYSAIVNYKVTKLTPTLQLEADRSADYTGRAAIYPATGVNYLGPDGNPISPLPNISYHYSTDDGATWTDGMPTNAGTYTIKATADAQGDYESAASGAVTFTINPAQITVTADNKSKNEGEQDPELTYTVEGLIDGDSLVGNLERAAGETPGSYAINQGTLTNTNNPNYDINFTPGTFTIGHTHQYEATVVNPTELALGGTHYVCTAGDDEYWDNFTRDNAYAQVDMPNGETIYHYCTHNGLATETTVDIGNGQTLRVFLQDPLRVLKKDDDDELGIVVEYIPEGTERYNELLSQRDSDHQVEHIIFFEVYPTINGEKFSGQLDGSVYMEYQIPAGWDEKDMEIILVNSGDDQEFVERLLDIDNARYIATWKTHFSPYGLIDKLSAEEKAELDKIYDNLTDDEKAELDKIYENLTDEEKAKLNAAKTGDELTYFTVSGLGLMMTLALGLILNTKISKKKSDE